MFGLSSASKEGRFAVLFDIGSASIGVSIVDFNGKPSRLVWYKRFEFGYTSGHDYERFSKTMYATLLEAGMKMSSEGFKTLKAKYPSVSSKDFNVYCVLSAPWVYSSVHTEVVSKEKPFQINSTILNTIAEDSLSGILNSQESLLWQEVLGTPEVLESYNDRVLLDGYPVLNYDKRSTKELSVKSYVAIVAKNVQEHIDEVIEKVFPNLEYSFSSSVRVLGGLKSHMYISNISHRSILIDVGEEITSIAILEKEVLSGVASIPHGTNHVLRAISPKAQTAEEARTALEVIIKKNKELDPEQYPESLQTTLNEWHQELVEKIRILSGGIAPPTEALLITGHTWSKIFTETLKTSWEMPGIRKNVELTVYPVKVASSKKEKNAPTAIEDNRLSIFAYLLSRYTE